jgi:hypothetical protein
MKLQYEIYYSDLGSSYTALGAVFDEREEAEAFLDSEANCKRAGRDIWQHENGKKYYILTVAASESHDKEEKKESIPATCEIDYQLDTKFQCPSVESYLNNLQEQVTKLRNLYAVLLFINQILFAMFLIWLFWRH